MAFKNKSSVVYIIYEIMLFYRTGQQFALTSTNFVSAVVLPAFSD